MTTLVLDIGGTAIKSGLYIDGMLTDIKETPTEASQGSSHVTARAKEIIAAYQQRTPFERIGVSTAGQVNPVRGQIIYANENIPGYTGTKLKGLLEQEFNVPVAVENDVNAAAIGEFVFGAGKGRKNFVCLTYGTGVGGAIFPMENYTLEAAILLVNLARLSHTPKRARLTMTCFQVAMRNMLPPLHW